jgi:hypothetical protein
MPYSLQNIVSSSPNPSNIGYNNNWIRVENNADRELFATASYITNFDDLSISLSAADLNIGAIHIGDPDNDQIKAGVAVVGPGMGALRVLSQDLEANVDTVSLGDINNNNVGIFVSLSALKTYTVNPVTSVEVSNPVNNLIVNYDSSSTNANLDAFGRLRMSTPTTLFDSKTLHNKSSLFWSQITNGAGSAVNFTGVFLDASITLSAANVNEYAIRQTTQRFNYQPGKSQLALFTGILNPVSNAIKRYGLFQSLTAAPYTPNVGLFFETLTTSPTSIRVVQLNEGFLVPSKYAERHEWNIDKLDGTGPSGKTLQLSAANIFLVDFEWLGVGRVRYGTVIDGKICYCHEFNNAGNVQGAYIRTPNLPVRAELRQVGSGQSSMKMICSSVMSEAGADFTGVTRSVDSGAKIPGANIPTDARRAIAGVRLQYNKLDSVNEVLNASVMFLPKSASTQAPFKYELLHNPTLASVGTWINAAADSNFQYWNGNSEITNPGTVIAAGFGSVGASVDLSSNRFEKFLRLGCSVDGRRDELFLVVTPLQAHDGAFGSLTFIESD